MADNMNCESNEKELNERIAKELEDDTFSNRDKLAIIIAAYFDSTPEREEVGAEPASLASVQEWFFEHCQSGKLLELQPCYAERVRSCYATIKDNHLLGEFWQEFKAYRQERVAKARAKKNKLHFRDEVFIDSDKDGNPVWRYVGIEAKLDKPSKAIVITDRTMSSSLCVYRYALNYNWKLPNNSGISPAEVARVVALLRKAGIVQQINEAIYESSCESSYESSSVGSSC